jgi:hypothetical protein
MNASSTARRGVAPDSVGPCNPSPARDHRRRPKRTKTAAGIWRTNVMIREAERELAQQAEASYQRMVKDQQAGAPARNWAAGIPAGLAGVVVTG